MTRKPPDSTLYWKAKDGRRLLLREMTTQHLKAALAMINRSFGWRERWREAIELELKGRKL